MGKIAPLPREPMSDAELEAQSARTRAAVAAFRMIRGYNYVRLAAVLRRNPITLSRWEQGRTVMTYLDLWEIARALNVPIADLYDPPAILVPPFR